MYKVVAAAYAVGYVVQQTKHGSIDGYARYPVAIADIEGCIIAHLDALR